MENKTFKLTKNILQNIEVMRNEMKRIDAEMNSRLGLLLDGFAQGCGLAEDEVWGMSADGLSIEFKPKEETKTTETEQN